MADSIISAVVEMLVKSIVNVITTPINYIRKYKSNFDDLNAQVQKLQGRRNAVVHQVNEAKGNGDEIEELVEDWLQKVNKKIEEAEEIIDKNKQVNMRCFRSLCPNLKNRHQHSKEAGLKAKEVSELYNEREFPRISYRTLPKEPWNQFLNDYKDFESRRSIVEKVLKALRSDDVNTVGIHGMGGAGKTTLARVVGKRAEEGTVFDVVVFVEVSETPNVWKIQEVIKDKLGLTFPETTEDGRASRLNEHLQKKSKPSDEQVQKEKKPGQVQKEKKILLILDNIWKGFDFTKVGIPLREDDRAFKLLWTARSIDVLSSEINTRTSFPVDKLNDDDSWELFQEVAGACIKQDDLKRVASEVAKRCGGLPVVIVTIAKALKGKPVNAWEKALEELNRPSSEVESVSAEAYSCIKLSYDQLNPELQSTFLLCSTMGFTSNGSVEKLFRYGMGLCAFRTAFLTMEAARNRVNSLVQELKNSSLLLDTPDSERFFIHDMVCDTGRAIAVNNFSGKENLAPWHSAEENLLKKCTSITLHDIDELPQLKKCPQLKFFYLKTKVGLPKISNSFFRGMPNLEVLHLIEMDLSPLPTSLVP